MFARARDEMLNDPADRFAWTSPLASGRSERRDDGADRPFRVASEGAATSDQLSVQRLIADLAARFVTVGADAIDDTVVDSLRQIAQALQLDRAIVWSHGADEARAVASHYWIKHPQSPVPETLQLASIPFLASKLEAGEASWFSRINDVPDPVDREAFLRHGLRSAVVVPVAFTGGAPGYPVSWRSARQPSANGRPRSSNSCELSRKSSARLWRAEPARKRYSSRTMSSVSCTRA